MLREWVQTCTPHLSLRVYMILMMCIQLNSSYNSPPPGIYVTSVPSGNTCVHKCSRELAREHLCKVSPSGSAFLPGLAHIVKRLTNTGPNAVGLGKFVDLLSCVKKMAGNTCAVAVSLQLPIRMTDYATFAFAFL